MKTLILAGGLGTRLAEETVVRPKPMVEIGGMPILWHIMKMYSSQGFGEFIIALGYKGELIKDYFLNYRARRSNLMVHTRSGEVRIADGECEDWVVHLLETGQKTQTGGRVKRAAAAFPGEPLMVTYGDGLANIDIGRLLAFHRSHGKLATVTAVRPPARFGGITLGAEGNVLRFDEKPQIGEGWINGGFMVFEPGVGKYVDGDATLLEREPMERLAKDGQLMAYRHEGFWQPMDTVRERQQLEDMWQSGSAPWKIW